MHTAEELNQTHFEYRSNGQLVSRNEIMPTITIHDRVGIVTSAGPNGIGAGNFLLSCVTAFYDRLRAKKAEFFEYPDYYTFQATTDPADYMMLDIYPAHKNVAVDAEPERLLRAINDRAINILLVPDGPTNTPEIDEITRRSAKRRIDHCYLYAPDGRFKDPGFSIRLPRHPTEDWYIETVQSTRSGFDANPDLAVSSSDSHIIQDYKQIPLDQALARLPTA